MHHPIVAERGECAGDGVRVNVSYAGPWGYSRLFLSLMIVADPDAQTALPAPQPGMRKVVNVVPKIDTGGERQV